MKSRAGARFDVESLRLRVDARTFARGDAYFREGRVTLVSVEPKRVLAQVVGSEDYRTVVSGRGGKIGGECSCPAFDDSSFCKHMVATALAANASGGAIDAEGGGTLAFVRDHLKALGVDALVEMIVAEAEHEPRLLRKLEVAAAATRGDDKTIEARLRKAIDSATRTRGFVDYREAAGWAAGVDTVIDAVAELVPAGHPGLAIGLAARVIDRVERAIEEIDDSDGHGGGLLDHARQVHLAAALAARPEPLQLARELFEREMASEYDVFDGAVALYAEALGETGLAEYRRLAAEAWAKLPAVQGGGRTGRLAPSDYGRLIAILDFFAEREGDVDTRIALRAKDLSSSWSYLQLAEFCLAQDRRDEALRWAEDGLWLFEDDRPDERLVLLVADLLSRADRKQDALARLWRAFEKASSLELYIRLRELGGVAARERALHLLEDRLTDAPRSRWHSPSDLLITILMREGMLDAAWAAVRRHGASMGQKESLARASELSHPREALEIYAGRVDQLVDGGGNPAYAEAVALIGRMARLREATEHEAYVAALKVRFGRKRNFMKLLG